MQAGYAGLLAGGTDIRGDEAYNEFFHLYQDHNANLPPPLDPSPDLLRARIPQQSDFAQVPPPESVADAGANTQPGMGVASFAAVGECEQRCFGECGISPCTASGDGPSAGASAGAGPATTATVADDARLGTPWATTAWPARSG